MPQQVRLHVLLASVMRRTNQCSRAQVKLHVHTLACTTHKVARIVPKEHSSLRKSDFRRTSCISPAQIGFYGARVSNDTGECSCSLAGGEFRAQEAIWRVPGASFTAAISTIACGSNPLIFWMTRSTSVCSLGVSCIADYPFHQTSALSLSSGNTTICSPSFLKISSVHGVMYCMVSSVGLSV